MKEKADIGVFYICILNSAEVYDPVTGNWTLTESMSTSRIRHTETVLKNGKVLITGGQDEDVNYLNTAELFDPSERKWTLTGNNTRTR